MSGAGDGTEKAPTADKTSAAELPSPRRPASISNDRRGWNVTSISGKMLGATPSVRKELIALDKDGNGQIDVDELAAAVEQLAQNRATIRNLKYVIGGMAFVCILIIGATFGLSFATVRLSRNLESGNSYALVDVSSGNTLRTAAGQLPAPYTLLDVITTSDNVTTVRYTLPKAVGEHGCRLYVEGRFSVPASLLGPDAVYGGSVRPRTYTILEVVGCTPGGTLSSTVPLEATLKAEGVTTDVFIFFTCPLNAGNCTAAQFVTANGTSLALHPGGINRRLLTAGTHEFLASLVTPTTSKRRAVLQAAVPGAVHPSGGLKAFTTLGLVPAVEVEVPDTVAAEAGTQTTSSVQASKRASARRTLQGLAAGEETTSAQQEGQADESQLAFYALPGWDIGPDTEPAAGRQLLYVPYKRRREMLYMQAASGRRRMSEGALDVYQRHIYASPDVDQELIMYYDCVLCTYMWRCGLLPDHVYQGDAAFGGLVKAWAPWVHSGYLTYGRKVVLSLHWLGSDWFTSQMVAPLASHWANTMAWLAGSSGAICSAEGLISLVIGAPGTLVLGLAQAALPVVVVDLMAWGMVGWITLHVLSHWAAATVLGMGWVGLVLPSTALLVAGRRKLACSTSAVKLWKQAS